MRWIIGVGTSVVLVAGVACRRVEQGPQLPAPREHRNLPSSFATELQKRRKAVIASLDEPDTVRNLAQLYHANRLYAEAQACYELLARDPANLTVRDHYYLADLARNQGDLLRAQEELRAVVAKEPDYIPARLAHAEVLLKSGSEDSAAQEYAAILAIDPDQLQAGVGLARLELQRGDEDAAVARLNELMAAHPESTSGAALLAPVLQRRGEADRAEALVALSQQKPEPAPDDPWMAKLLSDQYDIQLLGLRAEDDFRAGQIDAAQSLLNRIEELDPASPVPPLLRGQAEALAHRDEAAVVQFQLALDKGGDPEKICPSVTQSLLALGKVSEAAAFLSDYYAKFPESTQIARAYAEVLVKQEDNPIARIVLEKVLEKEPYLRAENMNLAQILWTAGERDAAAICLQRVADAQRDNIPSRALLGEYYLGKADPISAIPPLEQAFKLAAPETPVRDSLTALLVAAYIQAGNKQAEQGNPTQAAVYFDQAAQASPDSAEAYAGLAKVGVLLEDFSKAADALEHLAALQPGNPTILLSLGDVVYRTGEPETARQHWRRALDLVAPGDTELRHALEARLRDESMGDSPP